MKGSLTATTSTSPCSTALRRTMRPMRPKPLMPTLIVILSVEVVLRLGTGGESGELGGGRSDGEEGRERFLKPQTTGASAGAWKRPINWSGRGATRELRRRSRQTSSDGPGHAGNGGGAEGFWRCGVVFLSLRLLTRRDVTCFFFLWRDEGKCLGNLLRLRRGGGLQNQRCHRKRGRGERAWRRE